MKKTRKSSTYTELLAVKAECERLRQRCITLATEKINLTTELLKTKQQKGSH